MTTYREIAETETDPEAALTSDLFKALQKNLLASLEGDPTAPVNQWGWHPYNKVLNGDSNNGRIWSFAVDGAVSLITPPDFQDGWDYGFLWDRVVSTVAGAQSVTTNLFRETSGAYAGAQNSSLDINTTATVTGFAFIEGPRLVRQAHLISGAFSVSPISDAVAIRRDLANGNRHATAQKIRRVQFGLSIAASFTGANAAIYMLKRRNASS